jgi:hypothetical protein
MTYSVRLPHTDGEHIADTYEGAMDVVVGTIRSGNPPGGRWSLHFVGLEESEMSNFIRTAEIQTGGPSGKVNLAGFGRIEREFDSQFVTSLKQRYDVRRAKIVDVSVNEPASTTTHRAVDVTVDFPAYTAARPSLLMRVRLFFARTIPVRVQELATSVVNRVLTRQSVQQASTTGGARARALTGEDIAGAIRADLESLREPALKGISIQVDTTGGRKVYIVQLRRTQAG